MLLGQHIRISLEITAQEFPETMWHFRIVPPTVEIPKLPELDNKGGVEIPRPNIPAGWYLTLWWSGDFDKVPLINPYLPIKWERRADAPAEFSQVHFLWEMWSWEDLSTSTSVGSKQGGIPLGEPVKPGVSYVLSEGNNFSGPGEITFVLLQYGVSLYPERSWGRAEIVDQPSAGQHLATLWYEPSYGWGWRYAIRPSD